MVYIGLYYRFNYYFLIDYNPGEGAYTPRGGLDNTINPLGKLLQFFQLFEVFMLDGLNKICAKCSEKCKQWSQVKVIRCPIFKSAKPKHSEMAETGQV